MSFFKKFYLPSSKTLSENGDCDSNRDIYSSFKRTYLSPTLFVDSSAANDYVCKICHFMAVDPLEHVPGPNVTCSNIFCLPCVKTYSTSGLASCPAEGCLTSGFDWSSLRELGTREIARLSNLMLNCEFKCSQVIPYRDYWTHREKCLANPDNFCEICDSQKTLDNHNCRETFNQLKKRNKSLDEENHQLKVENNNLRRELRLFTSQTSRQITQEKWEKRVSSLKKEIHSLRNSIDGSGSLKQPKSDFNFNKDIFRSNRHQLASSSSMLKPQSLENYTFNQPSRLDPVTPMVSRNTILDSPGSSKITLRSSSSLSDYRSHPYC
ncbi:uncharacterized protein LOC128388601 [Panonychus citri]|uniref:uncharacterized protein LOC128388601 n=1 Tax=Panonychus citri TaxID=50023 RepID=UPI002307948D|nr:uncharacterized protein LOC128388601 [Panonychus citri]